MDLSYSGLLFRSCYNRQSKQVAHPFLGLRMKINDGEIPDRYRELLQLYHDGFLDRSVEINANFWRLDECTLPQEDLSKANALFEEIGVLKRVLYNPHGGFGRHIIQVGVVSAVWQADHQAPPDHWNKIVIWFRARRWSVPLIAVVVLAPALVGYVAMLQTLLKWVGVTK